MRPVASWHPRREAQVHKSPLGVYLPLCLGHTYLLISISLLFLDLNARQICWAAISSHISREPQPLFKARGTALTITTMW